MVLILGACVSEQAPTPRAGARAPAAHADAVRDEVRDGVGTRGGLARGGSTVGQEGADEAEAGRPRSGGLGGVVTPAQGTASLAVRIAGGDRDAFGAFYEAWFDRCYAMARSLTGRDESFCLDVVQEAMLRVVRRIVPMRSDADLARWMVRVVHTSAIDLLRQESRRKGRERAASRSERQGDGAAASGAGGADMSGWLARALADLDEQERGLVQLRFGRGVTLEQAGRATGIGGGAAHGRLRRLLSRLRGAAGSDGG